MAAPKLPMQGFGPSCKSGKSHPGRTSILHRWGTIVLVWSVVLCRLQCQAWTSSWLFKAKETFKLAELQQLEASLQIAPSQSFAAAHDTSQQTLQADDGSTTSSSSSLGFQLSRVLVDRATGSSLFRVELQRQGPAQASDSKANDTGDGNSRVSSQRHAETVWRSQLASLSSIRRCDWVGQVLAEGRDPLHLVEQLQHRNDDDEFQFEFEFPTEDGWTLDYVKMVGGDGGGGGASKKPTYTMKSLLCAVAHELPSRPSLTPAEATSRLLLVDTTTAGSNTTNNSTCCWLIQCLDHDDPRPTMEGKSTLQQKWAKRPFQYSSAINFEIAEMVLEILMTLCQDKRSLDGGDDSHSSNGVLLDPTCGSGTFLALGLAHGFSVEGCEINPSVAEGAIRNLEYLFEDDDTVQNYATVETRDSCHPWRHEHESSASTSRDISCVVANLPWGRNSVLYVDENERILRSIRSQIQTDTPCAFITRPSNAGEDQGPSQLFESTGFDVLGQAFVPQRDFLLPAAKKKRKKSTTENSNNGNSGSSVKQNQCVITIARAKDQE